MSIAAANLFTRTIYKELFRPYASAAEETRVARLVSLLMKVGALGFALELNKTFSINLQLLGGIWILQTFPAVVVGLYTRWFHRAALIIGWATGMAYGTVQAYRTSGGGQAHFGGSAAPVFGHTTYIAITALLLNLAVSAVLTVVFRGFGLQDGYDETRPADYIADPEPAPARTRARASARKAAEPAAAGKAPRDSAIPWPPGAAPQEASVPAEAAATPEAVVTAEAPDVEDDATIVFDIPGSLVGRPQSGERLPRRK
jgi:SSS family solute:Na+ symporter